MGGILFMGTAGEAMWANMNRGVCSCITGLLLEHGCSCMLMLMLKLKLKTLLTTTSGMQKLFKDLPQNDMAGKKVTLQDAAVTAVHTMHLCLLCTRS